MDISIVIVGRNEGFKLKKCFASIARCKSRLSPEYNFQTIYIDSNSIDDSVEIATTSDIDVVAKITGDINSAVARNVGVSHVIHDWILFVDGDMEIYSEFFLEEITESFFKKTHFFSGQFINVYYNSKWEKKEEEKFVAFSDIKTEPAPGGLFLIKKELWSQMGGMKDHYKRSQDYDLGLRLYKAGHPFRRINKLLANHHMIGYLDHSRVWEFFRKGHYLYSRSLLYRDHILLNFNINALRLLWKQDYTFVFLIVSIALTPITGAQSFFIYLVFVILRAIRNSDFGVFKYIPYIMARDMAVLLGFFSFYPKKKLQYTEEIIKPG